MLKPLPVMLKIKSVPILHKKYFSDQMIYLALSSIGAKYVLHDLIILIGYPDISFLICMKQFDLLANCKIGSLMS